MTQTTTSAARSLISRIEITPPDFSGKRVERENTAITLHGQTYRVARLDDERVVLRRSGSMWRVASERDRIRVLAGLGVSVLRVV